MCQSQRALFGLISFVYFLLKENGEEAEEEEEEKNIKVLFGSD